MDKLIKKFEDIIEDSRDSEIDMIGTEINTLRLTSLCAEECKKVAIEFAKFHGNYYANIYNDVISEEILFYKFIEEAYESI